MSREIKFRAWDKDAEYMLPAATIQYLTAQKVATLDESYYVENYEFMQFTGLQDRSGVDIYEGDVVRQEKNCMFDDGKIINKVSFNGKDQFVSGSCSLYQAVITFKAVVIGNIHENPELLEVKQ